MDITNGSSLEGVMTSYRCRQLRSPPFSCSEVLLSLEPRISGRARWSSLVLSWRSSRVRRWRRLVCPLRFGPEVWLDQGALAQLGFTGGFTVPLQADGCFLSDGKRLFWNGCSEFLLIRTRQNSGFCRRRRQTSSAKLPTFCELKFSTKNGTRIYYVAKMATSGAPRLRLQLSVQESTAAGW